MTENPDLEPELACLLNDFMGDSVPGIGVDVEQVDRWRGPKERLEVLFTEAERRHCDAKAIPAQAYAGLWCAKEAVFKALSPFTAVSLRDIELEHDTQGRPVVRITTRKFSWLASTVRVSISHTKNFAVAVAVARPELAADEGESNQSKSPPTNPNRHRALPLRMAVRRKQQARSLPGASRRGAVQLWDWLHQVFRKGDHGGPLLHE